MTSRKRSRSTVTHSTALHKEWDRISCPICMEHPHNAVLLICSSYKNGCRCYICNTSHRHSNCLDRFRKMNGDSKVCASHSTSSVLSNSDNRTLQRRVHYSMISRPSQSPRFRGRFVDHRRSYSRNISGGRNQAGFSGVWFESNGHQESANSAVAMGEGSIRMEECGDVTQKSNGLKCPLCRGMVSGWVPAEEVRQYLDQKLRNCSHDSCKFVGNYEQLREHARSIHTLMRPTRVDLSRQWAWNRLEREQEYGDVLSAIRSEMPGAIVVGDYVIETGNVMSPVHEVGGFDESNEEWWSPFFGSSMMRSPVTSPDNRHSSPTLWPNDRQRSPSLWSDERRGSPRLSLENRGGSPRIWPDDRGSSPRVWRNNRRLTHYSLWRQSVSHPRYDGGRGSGLGGSLDDDLLVPRRRRRLMRYPYGEYYRP